MFGCTAASQRCVLVCGASLLVFLPAPSHFPFHPLAAPPFPAPFAACSPSARIVTTFAIVASVVGASMGLEVVIVTGFAKLVGDAISMGLGDAISESAEQAHIRGERKREEWELEN
jgi:hypothetical protein